MIAEALANPNANLLWQTLEVMAVISGIVCPIMMVVYMRSDKKQRREISFEFEPVSKKDFEIARQIRDDEIKTVRSDMEKHRETAERERKISAAGVYRKIDEVRTELSANLETVRQELSENQRALPNEIVTLLKNTNAI